MTVDLHTQIITRLAELRTSAEAATPGPWYAITYGIELEVWSDGAHRRVGTTFEVAGANRTADVRYIAAWKPEHSLRWISWAEDVAHRHRPDTIGGAPLLAGDECRCGAPWPCDEIVGLAHVLGIEDGI